MAPEQFVIERLPFEAFCAIEREWDELFLDSPATTPFLAHPWLREWWRHFGPGQRFVAIVVRHDGRLVAALPLAIRRTRVLGLPVRVAEIVGTGPVPTRGMGLADRADALRRSDAPAALAALWDAVTELLGRETDLLHLRAIDAGSASIRCLTSRRDVTSVVLARSESPFAELAGGWDAYVAGRSAKFLRQLRHYRKMLDELGDVQVIHVVDQEGWRSASLEIRSIDQRSWKGRRGTNLLLQPEIWGFFDELVRDLLDRGWITVHLLRVGHATLAYEICFDVADRMHSYSLSFDASFARHAPGHVLKAAIIEEASARGRREFDMLRGMEPYKLRWSTGVRQESDVSVRVGGLRAWAYEWIAIRGKALLKQSPRLVEWDDRWTGYWVSRRGQR